MPERQLNQVCTNVSKIRQKTFSIQDPRHLVLVDQWWATTLRKDVAEIKSLEWTASGCLDWKLVVRWTGLGQGQGMNVGLPSFVEYEDADLEALKLDLLDEFEDALHDQVLLQHKVSEWGLVRGDKAGQVISGVPLAEPDQMIAVEFVWPAYQKVLRHLAAIRAQLQEITQELTSRQKDDYFTIKVDRGLLRESFETQIGYDNEFLFDEFDLAPEV